MTAPRPSEHIKPCHCLPYQFLPSYSQILLFSLVIQSPTTQLVRTTSITQLLSHNFHRTTSTIVKTRSGKTAALKGKPSKRAVAAKIAKTMQKSVERPKLTTEDTSTSTATTVAKNSAPAAIANVVPPRATLTAPPCEILHQCHLHNQ